MMPTFVQQAGMPFVALRTECNAGTTLVSVHQQRYFFDRERFKSGESKELWQVPVCLKAGGDAGAGKTCRLLTQKEARLTLPGCGNWTLANVGAEGFYRSGYDSENLHAITTDMEKGLTPAERIMLLGDVWASVRVGRHPVTDYLTLVEGLQDETSRPVMSEALLQVEYIGHYLTSDQDQSQYAAWVRHLLGPSIRRLGYESKASESDDDKEFRSRVLQVAGETGRDSEVLAWAMKWTDRALASDSPLDNTIADTAFSLAAREGDSALYDRMKEKQKEVKTPEDFYVYLRALNSFIDPKLIELNLNRALSSEVRSQDAVGVISSIMDLPAGGALAWDFTKRHWNEISKISGGFAGASLVNAASTFCSAEQSEQVEEFFTAHKVPSAERGLQQSLESIHNCTDLKSQQEPRLAQWLSDHEVRMGQ
jgi:aminopeptidase N/puromycin-sensitive aminopeptidase